MTGLHVSAHPLLQHKLARLRHKDTAAPAFRALVRDLTQILLFEATAGFALREVQVPTPLAVCAARELVARVGLVPVLRAGLGMADAVLELLPEAVVWHLGLYRDHETCRPVTYYNKLPPTPGLDVALVLDPMLATGGSAVEAVHLLRRAGVTDVRFVGLIAAPEGVRALRAAHPDVPLYLAAVDSHLDERSYIVPGLGDAGDRQFGTA